MRVSSFAKIQGKQRLGVIALVVFLVPLLALPGGAGLADMARLVLGASVAFAVLSRVRVAGWRRVGITVDEAGLHADGALEIVAADVDEVDVTEVAEAEQPLGGPLRTYARMVVKEWDEERVLVFRELSEAQRVAEALRSALEPPVRARFIPGYATLIERLALAAYAAAAGLAFAAWKVPGFGWTWALITALVATAVLAAGSTPVLVRASREEVAFRALGKIRRFAYRDVVRWTVTASTRRKTVVVRMRDGRHVTFHEPIEQWRHPGDESELERLVALLEAHRAPVSARTSFDPTDGDALRRRGRDVGAWEEALRAIAVEDASPRYRVAAVPPEALWRVVDDAAAPDDARVGAAVALRGEGSQEARVRIADAASRIANVEVKRSLEELAKEDADVSDVLRRVRED